MKKILLLLVLIPTICFAHPSKQTELNIHSAWFFNKEGNSKKAAALCTRWIEDENISNVDKVHYLVARSNFHIGMDFREGYDVDMELLKYLHDLYKECASEMFSYYEISFIR